MTSYCTILKVKQKNIVFLTRPICPPWDEASKNFAIYLAKNMSLPNVRCTLLTTKQKIKGFPPTVTLTPIHTTKSLNLRSKLNLLWYLLHTDADIVHSLFISTPLTGFIINIVKNIKKFKTIQTIASFSTNTHVFPLTIFGDVVVCFSHRSAQRLTAQKHKTVVIPPGIPLNTFKPEKKENNIAFLGELYRLGSYDVVEKIVETLLVSLPDYTITLGFRTSQKPRQETLMVAKLKKLWHANRSVIFRDVIDDMPAFLGKTKLVVIPATRVTGKFDYPLVALESLAAGTPIVISPIGAFSELGALPGVITPIKNDAHSFHKAIKKSLNTISKLSVEARSTAKKHFDIKNIVKKYETLYQKILS